LVYCRIANFQVVFHSYGVFKYKESVIIPMVMGHRVERFL